MRCAVSGYRRAGLVQSFGVVRPWAAAPEAPPARGYPEDQERAPIHTFAVVVLDLAKSGLLSLHEARGSFPDPADPALTGQQLREALANPSRKVLCGILFVLYTGLRSRAAVDSSHIRAMTGGPATGPSPVDRRLRT